MLVSIGKASKELGLSIDTLRRLDNEKKIHVYRTDGGHRRYDLDEIKSVMERDKPKVKITVIYARVSKHSDMIGLQNQINLLELYCAAHGWQYKIITDVGSSLFVTKPGMLELISLIESYAVERLVVTTKDRLLRFGNDLLFEMCRHHCIDVIPLSETTNNGEALELLCDYMDLLNGMYDGVLTASGDRDFPLNTLKTKLESIGSLFDAERVKLENKKRGSSNE